MKITQPDSRTVRIQNDDGVAFHLPYRFHWKGHDREPVSVVLESATSSGRTTSEVKAFFLFGMVSDRISSDARGITIARSWKVETPGPVRFLMDIDFETPEAPRFCFPGVHSGTGFPRTSISFLGEKTSYPAAVIVELGDRAVVIFSRSPSLDGEPASIGIRRKTVEDEPDRLHVEVLVPGAEEPGSRVGPQPGHLEEPAEPVFESPGSLERAHELFVSFAPRKEIFTAAPAAAASRLLPRPAGKNPPSAPIEREALRRACREVLSTHLVQENGVAGLRETPGSPWISSTAGAALAIGLRRLFPRDDELKELALRLADFSLKGQLPNGLFYESYHLTELQWRGVKGETEKTVLSVPHSAEIADLLLMLAEDLSSAGLPWEKYFLAGQRFVDHFIDEKSRLALPGSLLAPAEQLAFGEAERADARSSRSAPPRDADIGGWHLFFPLARVRRRTGRDKYKKALDAIARRFSSESWDPFHPPCSRAGRGPDSAASLLAVRLFVEMRRLGYRPAEPPSGSAAAARARAAESAALFASLLLPWIRLHGDEGQEQLQLDGTLTDGYVRQRILFAGNETAYLLLRLRQLGGKKELGALLRSLALLCLRSAREAPAGISFFQHTRWDQEGKPEAGRGKRGPVDARRRASEVLHGLLVDEEFSKLGRS